MFQRVCMFESALLCPDDEEGDHNVLNLFLDVVGQSGSGMPVESFFEDDELARTTVSCHLAMDPFCQEMQDAW